MGYDSWIWGDESLVTRANKRLNFIKGSSSAGSDDNLRKWRYIMLIYFCVHEVFDVIDQESTKWQILKYFTEWGWLLWGAYCLATCYAHYKYQVKGETLPADNSSPWQSWKICTVLFELALVCNMMVAIFYWGVMAPVYYQFQVKYMTFAKHAMPTTYLIFDWYLNKILFEMRHIWIMLGVQVCYMLYSWSYNEAYDKNVYGIDNASQTALWAILIGTTVAGMLLHVLFALGVRLRRKATASSAVQVASTIPGKANLEEVCLVLLP